jgi:predicted nucleic acid-binding protein
MITINGLPAVDTNVLLYSLDEFSTGKQSVARRLLLDKPVISSQNLSEFLNVLTKRWKYSKQKAMQATDVLLATCRYVPTERSTVQRAFELVRRYDFQLFDSLVVAAALGAGCTKLYSEDMQHGLMVENQLLILDPFR